MTTIRPTDQDWQRIKRSVLATERATMLDAMPVRRQFRFDEGGGGSGSLTNYYDRLADRVQQFKSDTSDRKQIEVSQHDDPDLGINSNANHIRFTKAGSYLVSFSIELECYWRGSNYAASLFELSCDQYTSAGTVSQGFVWHSWITTDNFLTIDHVINDQPSPLDTQSFCVHPTFIVTRKVDERIDIAAQQLEVHGSPITDVWLRYLNIVALEHT